MDAFRILILEDDQVLREAMASTLEDHGYVVEAVGRGQDAIEKARETSFDLVIVDVRMEGIDGLEALAEVKKEQPVVGSMVVTGYASEEDSIRAIKLGVDEYLKKPFPLKTFLESVESIAGKHHKQQRVTRKEDASSRANTWALETAARLADDTPPDLVAAGKVGGRLARELGLDPEMSRRVQQATLIAALVDYTRIPPSAEDGFPAEVLHLVEHRSECWDGSGEPDGLREEEIPIGSRIIAGVLAYRRALQEGPEQARRLREIDPGRFDPRVLDLLEDVDWREPDPHEERRGPNPATLLSLARALEGGGSADSARRAYTGLVNSFPASREAVDARLGLARLEQAAGNADEMARQCDEAVRLARQLGPTATAAAALSAGLLLSDERPREAAPLLEESAQLYRRLRLPEAESAALIAHMCLHPVPEHLESTMGVLMRSEKLLELADASTLLLPLLLEQQAGRPGASVGRALERLVREYPRRYLDAVASKRLSPAARLLAARALAHGGGSHAHRALELLAQDSEETVREAARSGLEKLGSESPSTIIRIYALGTLEVYRGQERVENAAWKRKKVRLLLARLISAGNQTVSEDVLVDTFWPEAPEKGRKNLYSVTSHLRSMLREGSKEGPDFVLRDEVGLRLNPEVPIWCDMWEFEKAAQQARRHRAANEEDEELLCHRRIAELYRGPYLESVDQEWADGLRARVERQALESLTRLAMGCLTREDFEEALEAATRALELDRCNQDAHLALMESQIALGRHQEAIRQYERCEAVLRSDLGMEPSIPLVKAFQKAKLAV